MESEEIRLYGRQHPVLGGGFVVVAHLDQQRLGQVLGQIRSACVDGNVRDLVAGDVHFHEAIMTGYGDPDLLGLWWRVIMRMMMRYDRFSDLMESFAEHRRIYEAVAARDEEAALTALQANII